MEQNPPILAKKVWSLIRVMFFMLKKTISNKTKFFADLNMMIKRGKIAGKTLHNILFHHHHHWAATTSHRQPHHLPFPTPPPSDDEFSCTTTPQHQFTLSPTKKSHKNHAPHCDNEVDEIIYDPGVIKTVEMLRNISTSPAFIESPLAKQLRITDSPFPLSNGDEDGKVDEAAEKFILRFYNGLRRED